jgi:glutathione S-transferase
MLKIYGQPKSRAFRVLWLAKEAGIPYEHIPVSITADKPECKEPWFVALNPNARVPAIDDEGFVMWESAAINLYLAEKYKCPLFPATPQARGRMLQWAFYIANDVEPPMITMFQNRVLFPPEKRNAALGDAAEAQLVGKLKLLEEHLAKNAYFGGDKWDMADFMVASVVYTLAAIKYDLSKYPKFNAWLMASIERPAAKEARKLRE